MSRGDPTYAHVDVTWTHDPRAKSLSPAENWLFMVCVLRAVELRSNVLSSADHLSTICRTAAVRRQTMKSLLQKAQELDPERPMIWKTPDGRICVPSMGKRHAKLLWKGEREGPWPSLYGDSNGPKTSPRPSLQPSVPPSVPPNSNQVAIPDTRKPPKAVTVPAEMIAVALPYFGNVSMSVAEAHCQEALQKMAVELAFGWLLVAEQDRKAGRIKTNPLQYFRGLVKKGEPPDWAMSEAKRLLSAKES